MYKFHGGCSGCTIQDTEGLRGCIGCKYLDCDWDLPTKNPEEIRRENERRDMRRRAHAGEGLSD